MVVWGCSSNLFFFVFIAGAVHTSAVTIAIHERASSTYVKDVANLELITDLANEIELELNDLEATDRNGRASSTNVKEVANLDLSTNLANEVEMELNNLEATDRNERASSTNVKELANWTLITDLQNEIEFELNGLQASEHYAKNKLILLVFELLVFPAMCGVDRCYMGQTALGIIKGVTLGGCSLWFTLDYFAVIITCLSFSPSINALGLHASLGPEDCTVAAFWLALSVLLLKFFSCCCCYIVPGLLMFGATKSLLADAGYPMDQYQMDQVKYFDADYPRDQVQYPMEVREI